MGCNVITCPIPGCGNQLKRCQLIEGVCPSCHAKGLRARFSKFIKVFISCF